MLINDQNFFERIGKFWRSQKHTMRRQAKRVSILPVFFFGLYRLRREHRFKAYFTANIVQKIRLLVHFFILKVYKFLTISPFFTCLFLKF